MTRIACVDLPALPLQLLWRREPGWRADPTVVVEHDRPQGKILWACDRARDCRILPGQRYAHALGLAPGLRAAVVSAAEQATAVAQIAARLHTRSPEIMRGDDPGTFWLGGDGLGGLYPSASAWARAIADDVTALGLVGVVVVGFSRFATYALARAHGHGLVAGGEEPTPAATATAATAATARRAAPSITPAPIGAPPTGAPPTGAPPTGTPPTGALATAAPPPTRPSLIRVLARDADERAAVCQVPLARLDFPTRLRDALARLGVVTLGQLVTLPNGGLLERFGPAAHRLYQLAIGERWDPLAPEPPPEAIEERLNLDEAEHDTERLLFAAKGALDRLLLRLAAHRRALTLLSVEWNLQRAVGHHERRVDHLRPAAPTLDGRSLLGLLRLRLEHQPPDAGVVALRVWADDVAATREQLALFATRPRRDLRDADRALARLRAELGDAAVVRAVLRPAHLPEAQFHWEPLARVVAAEPPPPRPLVLGRHVLDRPRALPPALPHRREDGWVLSREHGPIEHLVGPYVVSGGWWVHEVHRAYHFADTRRGDCLWLYLDRARRRWFHHGALA